MAHTVTEGQILSGITELLKYQYLPGLRNQIPKETVALNYVKAQEGTLDAAGEKFIVTAGIGFNQGVGARNDNEALPTARAHKLMRPEDSVKRLYGSIRVTGPSIAAAQRSEGAITDVLDLEMESIKTALVKDINRQLYQNSSTLAATAGATQEFPFAMAVADGVTTAELVEDDVGVAISMKDHPTYLNYSGAQWLQPGMVLDAYYDNTGVWAKRNSTGRIEVISVSGNLAYLATSADDNYTPAAGDSFIREGTYYSTDTNVTAQTKEINGFLQIANNTGTFMSKSRTTYPAWAGNVFTSTSARDISISLLGQAWNTTRQRSGMTPTLGITTFGVLLNYYLQLQSQIRYVPMKTIDGGWNGLAFNEIGLIPDMDCPKGQLFFLAPKHLMLAQIGGIDWMNKDGSILARAIGSATAGADSHYVDAYVATLRWYVQHVADQCNCHAIIKSLNES